MLQAGEMEEIAGKLEKNGLDIAAVQELRWRGSGCIEKEKYSFYWSEPERQTEMYVQFNVNKETKKAVLNFELIEVCYANYE